MEVINCLCRGVLNHSNQREARRNEMRGLTQMLWRLLLCTEMYKGKESNGQITVAQMRLCFPCSQTLQQR